MDLHMPVMNGYEAAEKIKERSSRAYKAAMTVDVNFRCMGQMMKKDKNA